MRPEGFVLAGGAGRRMGTDKARMSGPDGVPMAVAVGLALRAHCSRVRIVRHRPEEGGWSWPDGSAIDVVLDPPGEGRHPLWGLVAALESTRAGQVLVAPCDLVGLAPQHVAALVEAGPAVARVDGRVQPLLGLFEATEGARAREAAAAGESVMRFVRDYARVPMTGIRNVNAPEQLP